jgi:hypothetical protein
MSRFRRSPAKFGTRGHRKIFLEKNVGRFCGKILAAKRTVFRLPPHLRTKASMVLISCEQSEHFQPKCARNDFFTEIRRGFALEFNKYARSTLAAC